MKTKRAIGALVLGLMVLGLGVGKAKAATQDNIQLLVTPGVTYSVVITSVNASGYDFGTVNLNSTTLSTAPILVENNGDTNARWRVRIDSLASNWSAGAAPATDVYEMRALFTTTAGGQPPEANFTDSTDELVEDSFQNPSGGAEFEEGVDVDSVSSVGGSDQRRLWLYLGMPTANGQGATEKAFQLSIDAVAP